MIKAITLLYRRPDLTVAEFQRHWRDRHAGIIATLPGVRGYVQSSLVPECSIDGKAVFDGFAELWADDTEALREIAASPQYAAVLEDEERFLDRTATALILVDDIELKAGRPGPGAIKRIACLSLNPDRSVAEFQRQWLEQQGAAVARLPGLLRYLQSRPRAGAYRDGRRPRFDGFDIAWFADHDALQAARDSAQGRLVRAGWMTLAASPPAVAVTTEHVVI